MRKETEQMGTVQTDGKPTEDAVLEQVRAAIRGIEFGSILLKIHQGRVVGIETSTKVRLDHQ